MARVTVLGAGMMGSALCVPLSDSGHDVRLVGTHLDDHIIHSLRQHGFHPTLHTDLPSTVEPRTINELEDAASDADLLVVGVSSAGVRWAGERLASVIRPDVPVVMITKGLAWQAGELTLLPDQLATCFPTELRRRVRPAAIAGPCIAGELVRRVPTCVVLTGRDQGVCRKIAEWLRTPYYRVWPSDDLAGVQICAALKNAYAMGMAFGAGLHERQGGRAGPVALHNYEAAVLAQSVHEMQRLVAALGGDPQTVIGLAGVGDLNVTCNGGRTGRFGKLLGSGIGLTSALEQMRGETLECREILAELRTALPLLQAQNRLTSGSLPLLDHLANVALDGQPVEVPFERFFGP
jgi:glycerol-3-phosphate dehydrogenase (NAD(P)+)